MTEWRDDGWCAQVRQASGTIPAVSFVPPEWAEMLLDTLTGPGTILGIIAAEERAFLAAEADAIAQASGVRAIRLRAARRKRRVKAAMMGRYWRARRRWDER